LVRGCFVGHSRIGWKEIIMKLRPELGLTFDDVLLVPKQSSIRSRADVKTVVRLVGDIHMAIPLMSANMDTVTEANMAIAMAQAGGIGILHRFMPAQKQAEAVRRVKRAESFVVENPVTISPDATIDEAREAMIEASIGGLVVTSTDATVLGMITSRDVLLAPDPTVTVASLMTPREKLVVAHSNEPLDEARLTLHARRIEKLPLVDDQNHVTGLITAQDIIKIQEHPMATKDAKGRLRVGVAIGVRSPDLDRAAVCLEAGADLLVVDIAHGHATHVIEMVKTLKQEFPDAPVIAGNVATAEGVKDLVQAGADAVKVGVGSGSICTTRIVTGFGVPQLTALMDCVEAANKLDVPIISDGGIRNSGDVTKALAAGASSVMLGSMLAGTDESPGASVIREGRRFKVIRGMASLTANVARKEIEKQGEIEPDEWEKVVPEGVEAMVPHRGAVTDILHQIVGGLRSGMSYAGATTLEELWQNAEFIRITQAGMRESGAHDVNLL
jgi:IMP dehydrogenase